MNEAIKTLLRYEPKALNALHTAFGFDYNKPFQAVMITEKTTVKKLWKSVSANENSKVIVLSKVGKWINPNCFEVAELIDDNNIFVDFSTNFPHCPNLGTYHRKTDFRSALKDYSEPIHIVISQDKNDLTPIKKENSFIDLTKRYILDASRIRTNTWGISTIAFYDIQSKGELKQFSTNLFKDSKEITDFIDKSGYLVAYKRRWLAEEADIQRKAKTKAAFLTYDTSEKVNELSLRIEAKRLDIIELLKNAKDFRGLKQVSEKLSSWQGLLDVMYDFENMKKKINEKSYESITEFENNYKQISLHLTRI